MRSADSCACLQVSADGSHEHTVRKKKRLALCKTANTLFLTAAFLKMVGPERFELPAHRFVACCSIQLSYEPTAENAECLFVCWSGGPGEIRTPGTQVRSLLLYPAELRAHTVWISRSTCTPANPEKFSTPFYSAAQALTARARRATLREA